MLLGSIPFGHIAVYIRTRDSSEVSSRGIAAIRDAVGWPGLIAVVILNIAKGFVPVFLTTVALYKTVQACAIKYPQGGYECMILLSRESIPIALLAGAIAVLSHCFPYWLMFRPSGKGGSVAIGVGLGLVAALMFKYI